MPDQRTAIIPARAVPSGNMTHPTPAAAPWWSVPPARRVSFLAGADPDLLAIDIDPLPSEAPAVVQFHPKAGCVLGEHVTVLVDELERVAIELFPAWLPGADRLSGPEGLGTVAVRALADQRAARSPNFGPFLRDLAERSLRASTNANCQHGAQFPLEVRARGLTRLIADAYGRDSTALLVTVPDGLSAAEERALTDVAEWLALRGRMTVWLAGAPLKMADRIRSVLVTLPEHLTKLVTEVEDGPSVASTGPTTLVTYPPLSGLPRPDSAAEQALERTLALHEWADGRHWNYTYEWNLLRRTYRLDLFWPLERLVVEVDGPEHRGRLQFADDRRRDVQLHALGHIVLRFTNEQVLSDIHAVVTDIEQVLALRRADMEMRQYVQP